MGGSLDMSRHTNQNRNQKATIKNNQTGACKGSLHVRRFHPDIRTATLSFYKQEHVFMYWPYLNRC